MLTERMHKNRARLLGVLGLLAIGWVLASNLWINKTHFVEYFMHADGAGEIQLAKTMYDNGEWVLSQSWYYSTELRFLHNQLFMVPLFGLFNTTLGVHLAATFLIGGFMALSAVVFFRSVNRPWWVCFFGGALIITPFSREIFYTNLANCYYSMFTSFVFLFLAAYNFAGRPRRALWRRMCAAGVLALAFVLGLCGVRYAVILFIPGLLVAGAWALKGLGGGRAPGAVLLRGKYAPAKWLAATGAYLCGYAVYEKVLLQIYTVADMPGRTQLSSTVDFISKLRQVPGMLLMLLGELLPGPAYALFGVLQVLRLGLAVGILACGVYVWLRRAQYSEALRFYIDFSWAALGVSILAMALVSDYHNGGDYAAARYLLPGILPLCTLPLLLLQNRRLAVKARGTVLAAVVLALAVNPVSLHNICVEVPEYSYANNYEYAQLQDDLAGLRAMGYRAGYGSFMYAGASNVLSNHALEVVGVYVRGDGLQYRTWLEPKDHDRVRGVDGPRFLIVTADEYRARGYLEELGILFEHEHFVVLDVEDIDALLQ